MAALGGFMCSDSEFISKFLDRRHIIISPEEAGEQTEQNGTGAF